MCHPLKESDIIRLMATKKKIKRIYRPKKGRKIAGVSLAFANYFDLDVTVVRLIWVFLFIPGGLPGIIPYLICWVVIPSEGELDKS